MSKRACLGLVLFLLVGCGPQTRVQPVAAEVGTDIIFVERNDRLHMEGFHPELVRQVEQFGYRVEEFTGDAPDGARFVLTYTANWRWDLAMYLYHFRAELRDRGELVGHAEYNMHYGLNKFGPTADKIRPLLRQMFRSSTQDALPESPAQAYWAKQKGESE